MSVPKPERFGGILLFRQSYSETEKQDKINDISQKIARYLIPRFSSTEIQPDGTTRVNIDMVVMGKKEFDAYVLDVVERAVRGAVDEVISGEYQ